MGGPSHLARIKFSNVNLVVFTLQSPSLLMSTLRWPCREISIASLIFRFLHACCVSKTAALLQLIRWLGNGRSSCAALPYVWLAILLLQSDGDVVGCFSYTCGSAILMQDTAFDAFFSVSAQFCPSRCCTKTMSMTKPTVHYLAVSKCLRWLCCALKIISSYPLK